MNTIYLNCGDEEWVIQASYTPQVNSVINALHITREGNVRRTFIIEHIEYPINLHDNPSYRLEHYEIHIQLKEVTDE